MSSSERDSKRRAVSLFALISLSEKKEPRYAARDAFITRSGKLQRLNTSTTEKR